MRRIDRLLLIALTTGCLLEVKANPASVWYGGLEHLPLGQASLGTPGLRVSDIGSSGADGVQINLGQADFFKTTLRDIYPYNLSQGASVQITTAGCVDGQPGQTISSLTLTENQGSINLTVDFSSLNVQTSKVTVYDGDQVVAVLSGIDSTTSFASFFQSVDWKVTPCGRIPVGCQFVLDVGFNTSMILPNGQNVTGSRIVIEPEGLAREYTYTGSVAVTGKDVEGFRFGFHEFGKFEQTHIALGAARFQASQTELTVSNIGSSGFDGVSWTLDGIGAGLPPDTLKARVEFQPLRFPANSSFNIESYGIVSGQFNSFLGRVSLHELQGGMRVEADFSGLQSIFVDVEVYLDGNLVNERNVIRNDVGDIADLGNGLPLLLSCESTIESPSPGYRLQFDRLFEFTHTGGGPLQGNELRLLAATPNGIIEERSRLRMTGTDLGSFTIINEGESGNEPTITAVEPSVLIPGAFVKISGTRFGTEPDDLSLTIRNSNSGEMVALRVISVQDNFLTALVGEIPPGMTAGELRLNFGVGSDEPMQPLNGNIGVIEPIWRWSGTAATIDHPLALELIHPPDNFGPLCFRSGPPALGELCLFLEGDWIEGTAFSIHGRVEDSIFGGLRTSLDAPLLRVGADEDLMQCAVNIADLIREAVLERTGVTLEIQVSAAPDDQVKITVGIPFGGFIDEGFLNVCFSSDTETMSISRAVPPREAPRNLISVRGSGIPANRDDLNLFLPDGNGFIPVRLISSAPNQLVALIVAGGPNALTVTPSVERGRGMRGFFTPRFPEIAQFEPTWAWRSYLAESMVASETFRLLPSVFEPGVQQFLSGPASNGELSLLLQGDWPGEALLELSARIVTPQRSLHAAMDSPSIFLSNAADVTEAASFIIDVWECSFQQMLGIDVDVRAEEISAGQVRITMSLPNDTIEHGQLTIRVRTSPADPVITDVSPLTATEGDILTITGSGFGDEAVDLSVTIEDENSASLIALDILEASDSLITGQIPRLPPQFPSGRVVVRCGTGMMLPADTESLDIFPERPHHLWRGGGPESVFPIPVAVTPPPPPPTGVTCFYGLADGIACVTLEGDWPSNALVSIRSTLVDPIGSSTRALEGNYQALRLRNGGTTLECAEEIATLLRSTITDIYTVTVTPQPDGKVKLTLRAYFPIIWQRGYISVCIGSVPELGITDALPNAGIPGDLIALNGSGLAGLPIDLKVGVQAGTQLIPFDVLSAEDDTLTLSLGPVPANEPPGPITVARGTGVQGFVSPSIPGVQVPLGASVWRGAGNMSISQSVFSPIEAPPGQGLDLHYSTPPSNGKLSIVLPWMGESNLSLRTQFHDQSSGTGGYALEIPAVMMPDPGDPLLWGEQLINVIQSAFWQQSRVWIDVAVTDLGQNELRFDIEIPGTGIDLGYAAVEVHPALELICPDDLVVACESPSGTTVTYGISFSGFCLLPTLSCTPPTGSAFRLGTTPVECTLTDDCLDQSTSCNFDVTIVDTRPPQLHCPPSLAVFSSSGNINPNVSLPVTATDTCDGVVAVNCTPPSGSVFSSGVTAVDCLAEDSAGNEASCSFFVTVNSGGTLLANGIPHEAIGEAVVTRLGNDLALMSPGLAPEDGVRVNVGEADGWMGEFEPFLLGENQGLAIKATGPFANNADHVFSSTSFSGTADSSFVSVNFAGVGAQGSRLVVRDTVGNVIDIRDVLNNEHVRVEDMFPGLNIRARFYSFFMRADTNWFRVCCPSVGSNDVERVLCFSALDIDPTPFRSNVVDSIELYWPFDSTVRSNRLAQGGPIDPASLVIRNEDVFRFNHFHRALGEARVVGDGGILVTGIGSSGLDGVSVDLDRLGNFFQLPAVRGIQLSLSPVEINEGESLTVSATGTFGSRPNWPLGSVSLSSNLRMELTADFSPVSSSQTRVEVYNGGTLVGTGQIQDGSGPLILSGGQNGEPSLVGVGRIPNHAAPSYALCLDRTTEFELPDSSKFNGDEIRLLASDVPGTLQRLSTMRLQGENVGSITLVDETVIRDSLRISLVNGEVSLEWEGVADLLESDLVEGPYLVIPNAMSPLRVTPMGSKFYLLRRNL